MNPPALSHYLLVSGLLFSIGLFGVLTRRNILMILLSVELILNSANLSFVAFSYSLGNLIGQAAVFFTMIVAATEVTVGLAIVLVLYRKKRSTQVESIATMKW